jgi:hypothetical protein
LRLDTETSVTADAIGRALTRDQASEEQRMAATEVAHAQLELLLIRAVRAESMAMADLAPRNLEQLQRLAALDRYERRRPASGIAAHGLPAAQQDCDASLGLIYSPVSATKRPPSGGLFVPELTRSASIQLNRRVSLAVLPETLSVCPKSS